MVENELGEHDAVVCSLTLASVSSGALLSEPTSDPCSFTRTVSNYEDHSQRFCLPKDRGFQRQYACIYSARLNAMRPKLEQACKRKWGDVPITSLCGVKPGQQCVIIGTLFKRMPLKPSILKEICKEHSLLPQPVRSKFVDPGDELVLEDDLQRITLVGGIDVQKMVTGVIIAVRGGELDADRGKFHVEDVCFQDLPAQLPRPLLPDDRFVALVSGLDLGGAASDPMALQLLIDLLTGQLGDAGQQGSMAKVSRLIVAGNCLSRETQDRDQLHKARYLTKKAAAGSVNAIMTLDDVLVQLASSMDVDVMPGEFDPANYSLPQQPLHRCMFPQALRYPTMQCVTNPYDCTVDGVRFLGTAGQPICDVNRYSEMDDHLEILEKTLIWGHLVPTAPDTLGCFPFADVDPFILRDTPHVYFAGNMPSYAVKHLQGAAGQDVLLLTVPRFSQSKTVLLVNLRTLECQPVTFDATLTSPAQADGSPSVDK